MKFASRPSVVKGHKNLQRPELLHEQLLPSFLPPDDVAACGTLLLRKIGLTLPLALAPLIAIGI